MTAPLSHPPSSDDDARPHLPMFRTWRGVYCFAFGCYVSYVVLLAAWTRWFS
jgi:hypothetical protein